MSRTATRAVIAAVVVVALLGLVCLAFVPTILGGIVQTMRNSARLSATACGGPGLSVDKATTIEGLTTEQVGNAGVIVEVGQRMAVPPRGWVIGVATAMQESRLRNLRVAVDHDSLGLFQQRPSTGWGTPAQILDPRYASAKFYQKLVRIPGWQTIRLTDAAQAVQISAFPDRYQQWEPLSTLLVNRLTGGAANGVAASAGEPVRCPVSGEVSGAGWTVSTPGTVGSGFRGPGRPNHQGVDIMVARHTPIRAASAGIVITSVCNASTGNCDVDGSPAVRGCGWYVEIAHGGGITTRYCHMVRQPQVSVGQRVTAGQVLGQVGSSGNSSGPHLHYETRINGDAVDPVPFMAARGAPLGGRQ